MRRRTGSTPHSCARTCRSTPRANWPRAGRRISSPGSKRARRPRCRASCSPWASRIWAKPRPGRWRSGWVRWTSCAAPRPCCCRRCRISAPRWRVRSPRSSSSPAMRPWWTRCSRPASPSATRLRRRPRCASGSGWRTCSVRCRSTSSAARAPSASPTPTAPSMRCCAPMPAAGPGPAPPRRAPGTWRRISPIQSPWPNCALRTRPCGACWKRRRRAWCVRRVRSTGGPWC